MRGHEYGSLDTSTAGRLPFCFDEYYRGPYRGVLPYFFAVLVEQQVRQTLRRSSKGRFGAAPLLLRAPCVGEAVILQGTTRPESATVRNSSRSPRSPETAIQVAA